MNFALKNLSKKLVSKLFATMQDEEYLKQHQARMVSSCPELSVIDSNLLQISYWS